jgi:hypothetical protein
VADTRALSFNASATRYADASFASDVAAEVSALYSAAAAQGSATLQLSGGAVVVSSVHRLALYAAEALHAPVLPAQTLAFAQSWQGACSAAASGSIVLVGCDFGMDALWLWIKPGSVASIPAAQVQQLNRSSTLLLLAATDGDEYLGSVQCSSASSAALLVHSSLASCAASPQSFPKVAALLAEAEPLAPLPPGCNSSSLRQWEWGLPSATLAAYAELWSSLGKPSSSLRVLQGGVVPGYLATPLLWEAYLRKNGRAPRGVSLYSYWMAQPSVDRADATLPIPAYAFYKPAFTTVWAAANATLHRVLAAQGGNVSLVASHSRAFMNGIGSSSDVQGAQLLFAAAGLPQGPESAWLSVGLDCPPATCTDALGSQLLPCAHAKAADVLQQLQQQQQPEQQQAPFVPLSVAEVAAAVAPFFQ